MKKYVVMILTLVLCVCGCQTSSEITLTGLQKKVADAGEILAQEETDQGIFVLYTLGEKYGIAVYKNGEYQGGTSGGGADSRACLMMYQKLVLYGGNESHKVDSVEVIWDSDDFTAHDITGDYIFYVIDCDSESVPEITYFDADENEV